MRELTVVFMSQHFDGFVDNEDESYFIFKERIKLIFMETGNCLTFFFVNACEADLSVVILFDCNSIFLKNY